MSAVFSLNEKIGTGDLKKHSYNGEQNKIIIQSKMIN